MLPFVLEGHTVRPGDGHRHERAGHRVETGGKDDRVELERLLGGVDTSLGDRRNRGPAQVDQPDVGQVEGLEVAAVQARTLGTERVVLRAERVGDVRVADNGAYLLPDHPGDMLIGDRVDALVAEHPEDREQLARLPRGLEALAADLLRRGHAADIGELARYAAPGPAGGLAVAVAIRGELGHAVRRRGAVARGNGEVRRPLEHGQPGGLAGDQRDALDSGGAGPHDRHPFPAEVHPVMRPPAGQVDLASVAVDAVDVGCLRQGQAAARHDVVPAAQLVAVAGAQPPAPGGLVPDGSGDPGAEPDIPPQVVAVRDVPEVGEDLRLRGVFLRPGPVLLEAGVEAVGVVGRGHVAAGTGIAVPVPGPADVARVVEHHGAQPEPAQPVEHVQPGEPGADHGDVNLGGQDPATCHCHPRVLPPHVSKPPDAASPSLLTAWRESSRSAAATRARTRRRVLRLARGSCRRRCC